MDPTPEQVRALAVQLAWEFERCLWQREDDPLPAEAPVYAGLFVDEQAAWLAVARAAWAFVRMAERPPGATMEVG
jgi:hypothetical protein